VDAVRAARYAYVMRTPAIALWLAALVVPCFGGPPGPTAQPAVHLSFDDTDGGTHFNYSISHPELVRSAWIEALDRPLVLAKKAIAVQPYGELTWDWNQGFINFFQQPEDQLLLSIWDPKGETVSCDVNTVMTAHPGGVVSVITVGARENLAPYPRLAPSFKRVTPGSDSVALDVTGEDLGALTKFHVQLSKGARCGDKSLHTELLDLAHARVTLGAECLQTPGILSVSTDGVQENSVLVHVVGRKSPVLRSVSPATLPADLLQAKLTLTLYGSGFTESSTVYAGYFPDAGGYDQLSLETEYVSPTELRATTHPNSDESTVSERASGRKLRLWVRGSEENYELSEPRDVVLRSAAGGFKLLSVADINFLQAHQKLPIVTAVSPYPIALRNARSPEELKVTIHGENFVQEDKVRFAFGSQSDMDREVRTEYVSPTMLRAWLPRQYFRKHQVAYRIVIESNSGQRYSRQVDDNGDEQ
jgi:hypothetical protein